MAKQPYMWWSNDRPFREPPDRWSSISLLPESRLGCRFLLLETFPHTFQSHPLTSQCCGMQYPALQCCILCILALMITVATPCCSLLWLDYNRQFRSQPFVWYMLSLSAHCWPTCIIMQNCFQILFQYSLWFIQQIEDLQQHQLESLIVHIYSLGAYCQARTCWVRSKYVINESHQR